MSAVPPKVRKAVLERDSQRCARCGRSIHVLGFSLQHRRSRNMGGSRLADTNGPTNLVTLCGSATTPGGCHERVESRPVEALEDGWRVRQGHDPATVPIKHWELGLVLLADDYTYEEQAA